MEDVIHRASGVAYDTSDGVPLRAGIATMATQWRLWWWGGGGGVKGDEMSAENMFQRCAAKKINLVACVHSCTPRTLIYTAHSNMHPLVCLFM